MKRQLLFAAVLVIGFNASAQFTKSEKVLSGNISFNTNKNVSTNATTTQENKISNFLLNTNIGWVKSEKRISGFRIGYYNNISKPNNGETKSTVNNISLGMFDQKIKSLNNSLFGFFETSFNGSYSWNKNFNYNLIPNKATYNGYGINANASVGLGYRINKHFIADATLSNLLAVYYTHTYPINTSTISTNKNDSFSISSSLSSFSLNNVAIGFRYVFQ